MKRNSLLRTVLGSQLCVALLTTGCGPVWYGPPPPAGPVGRSAPTPVQPSPAGPTPAWSPTPGASSARDLGAVPSVPAEQVLEVPRSGGPESSTWHEVRSGETLSSIAQKYGVTVDSLRESNYFDQNAVISPGDLLLIPKK